MYDYVLLDHSFFYWLPVHFSNFHWHWRNIVSRLLFLRFRRLIMVSKVGLKELWLSLNALEWILMQYLITFFTRGKLLHPNHCIFFFSFFLGKIIVNQDLRLTSLRNSSFNRAYSTDNQFELVCLNGCTLFYFEIIVSNNSSQQ